MSHYMCYNNLDKKIVEVIFMNRKNTDMQEKTFAEMSTFDESPQCSSLL